MTVRSCFDGWSDTAVPVVLLGVMTVATLLGLPVSAQARSTDQAASVRPAPATSVPVLAGHLSLRLEQHSRSGSSSGGGHAVPRGGGAESAGGGGSRSGNAGGSSTAGGARTRSGGSAESGGDSRQTPTYSRPRGGQPATGTAVERRPGDGGPVDGGGGGYYGGFYPWGWGGLGLGGYYGGHDGGYYDYDPFGYYDAYPAAGGYGYSNDGSLKIKVKPRDAEVYVDGYFAGVVDDYDGIFQSLRLMPGPHRVEVRMNGYEPLAFEVRIQPDRTITYKSEMHRMDDAN